MHVDLSFHAQAARQLQAATDNAQESLVLLNVIDQLGIAEAQEADSPVVGRGSVLETDIARAQKRDGYVRATAASQDVLVAGRQLQRCRQMKTCPSANRSRGADL